KRLIDTGTNQPVSVLAALEATTLTPPAKPPVSPVQGEFLDQNGVNDPAALSNDDFEGKINGARDQKQGLQALELDPYRDVALVYAPHPPDNGPAINRAIIDHCERMR